MAGASGASTSMLTHCTSVRQGKRVEQHKQPSMTNRAPRVVQILAILTPLLIVVLWGGIYADTAYRQFQQAYAIARGSDRSFGGFSPGYTLALAVADRLPGPLPPVAMALSVVGWMVAIASWFWVGLALDRPMFSMAAVLLLALHPLQPQTLGLESGLVLGLWGLATLLAIQRRGAMTLIAMVVAIAVHPMTIPFAVSLLIFSQIWRRSLPTLAHIAMILGIGLAAYTSVCALGGECREPRLMAVQLGALQLLSATGFAYLVPHLDWVVRPVGDRRTLKQGIVSLCLVASVIFQADRLLQDWHMRPVDRPALFKALATWLRDHTLSTETIGAQESGLLGYLTDRSTSSLPETTQVSDLMAAIDRMRPDYCIALDSLVWHGVRSQPWFQQRYEQVHQLASPYDSATPLTVFRYTPTPFDAGETISVMARFTPDAEEWIELTAYRVDKRRITPGEPLHLTLHWRAATAVHQSLFLVVRLLDPVTEKVWTKMENPTPGGLATEYWNSEMRLVDRYTLVPPADLPPGDYVLGIAFYFRHDPATEILGAGDGDALQREPFILTQIYHSPNVGTIPLVPDNSLELTFGDEVELIGYDLPERIVPGGNLRVALYWHSLRPVPRNYKVFVHLFAPDDQLLVQDDSIPVNWTYPTTRWQPGEYIRDEHLLAVDPTVPSGFYTLSMGLYDAATGERVVVRDGDGNEIPEGRVVLRQVQVRLSAFP